MSQTIKSFESENYITQPIQRTGYTLMNPQCIASKLSPGYLRTSCPGAQEQPTGTKRNFKTSNNLNAFTCPDDPRLFDAARGFTVPIDSPPISINSYEAEEAKGNINPGYGKSYRWYNDINAGQITYYIDKSLQDAYFNPVYTNEALIKRYCYKDPMDKTSIMWIRRGMISDKNDACLSSITDLNEIREEQLSTMMRARNRQRYDLNYLE